MVENKVNKTSNFVLDVCDCEMIHADVVEDVRDKMHEKELLHQNASFFKVLGDPTRMRIVAALDKSEMCVCDLAVLLNMTKSAISHQLKTLREANFVKSRRDGKVVYYTLKDEHVRIIFEMGIEHVSEVIV